MALFVLIAASMATDLFIEYRRHVAPALQSFESLIFIAALAGIAVHWRRFAFARRELGAVREQARILADDAGYWREEAQHLMRGLGAAFDRQFDRWGLTVAEREVALLQLKGLRHKQIAELRQTSERTVRQQALSIYRKSGLEGRSDLAAFFLEDLLLPMESPRT